MDLWQLKVFVAVVDHRSFSKASEAINLSQPTVSSHIKELETFFNCQLLDRMGKSTEPTMAGKLLYGYALKILNLKNEAETRVFDFLGKAKGELTIGGSTIPSGFILPRLIGRFSTEYPDVNIQLTAGDTLQIATDIIDGRTEIGIIGARIEKTAIRQERLLSDEMKLIIPANHPWAKMDSVRCEDLIKEKIIAREKGSGTWKSILDSMIRAKFSPDKIRPVITMGNTTSVIQGILNNVGISILSTIAVEDDLKLGRLKALSIREVNLNRHFYLTLPSRRTLSPICKKFIQFLQRQFDLPRKSV